MNTLKYNTRLHSVLTSQAMLVAPMSMTSFAPSISKY